MQPSAQGDVMKADLTDRSFWLGISTSLSLSSILDIDPQPPSAPADKLADYEAQMKRDGAFVLDHAIPKDRAQAMCQGIEDVRRHLGHEIFTLMYDEFWISIFEQRAHLEHLMGSGLRLVPVPVIVYVAPGEAGFGPHRDRESDPLAPDGRPNIMTVWFALTEAGTDRACLAIIPTQFDTCFPDRTDAIEMGDSRNFRALPVDRGGAVVFNQAVVHWGTRNISPAPRISFGMEIERPGSSEARDPAVPLSSASITFEERLGFIGATVGLLRKYGGVPFEAEHLAMAWTMTRSRHGDKFDHLWEL
jgi:hypothetical protein